ncbi:hypothetical protein HZA87_01830 [Candidatus Uhrbacteria bacterium]|nr:hypothetical protein [Candidatus Uhrbacteria bacterium]
MTDDPSKLAYPEDCNSEPGEWVEALNAQLKTEDRNDCTYLLMKMQGKFFAILTPIGTGQARQAPGDTGWNAPSGKLPVGWSARTATSQRLTVNERREQGVRAEDDISDED